MGKFSFDLNDGDFVLGLSDSLAMDMDGNLMHRLSDNTAYDIDSGELHILSSLPYDDDEDD